MLFAFTFLQLLKLIPGGDFAKWSIQRLQKEFFNTPIIIRKRGGKEVWEMDHDCKCASLLENLGAILKNLFNSPIEKPQSWWSFPFF